ncbi:hypothetical protein [Thermonema sp.]|jgi:hypothetical protein|nr:hypothetical protein [Thermonema sp.]
MTNQTLSKKTALPFPAHAMVAAILFTLYFKMNEMNDYDQK